MGRESTFSIEGVTVIRTSPKAILVKGGEFRKDTWLPKSQLKDGTDIDEVGDEGTVVIPEWLAEAKGLLEDEEDAGEPGGKLYE